MKVNNKDKTFWLPPNERIGFYLNRQNTFEIDLNKFNSVKNKNYWNRKEMHLVSYRDVENTFAHWYCKHIVHLPYLRKVRVLPFYKAYKNLHSLMNFLIPFDQLQMGCKEIKYPMYYGETGDTDGIPCIRKSRRSNDQSSVIFNFRTLRLTQPCKTAQKLDIPWEQKQDNVIWRGATTGKKQRAEFVERYYKLFDVGFASTKQKPHLSHLKKNLLSIKEQLKYKFIVSLEGNDVASNLRWVLSSNSIPIMTKPYWQSWIMEEKLKPNIHYLELNEDHSNLEEILDWASKNDQQCNKIAENGKKYMAQFLDMENDLPIQKMLLEEYAKRVTYITTE